MDRARRLDWEHEMRLTLTTPPAEEPITTAEAKAHLRVDTSNEDALVASYIEAARLMVEAYSARQLVTATYTLRRDDFPDSWGDICLPRTPNVSVSSIAYVDTSGNTQTLSTTVYELVQDDVSAKVVLKPDQDWPEVQSEKHEAVTVTFTVGYGAASAVPENAKTVIKQLVELMFDERIGSDLPPTITALMDTFAIPKVI